MEEFQAYKYFLYELVVLSIIMCQAILNLALFHRFQANAVTDAVEALPWTKSTIAAPLHSLLATTTRATATHLVTSHSISELFQCRDGLAGGPNAKLTKFVNNEPIKKFR